MPRMLEGERRRLETALEETRERLRRSRQREAAKDHRIERLRAELDKRRQYPKMEQLTTQITCASGARTPSSCTKLGLQKATLEVWIPGNSLSASVGPRETFM